MLELGKYYQQRNGVVVGPMLEYTPTSVMFHHFSFQGKNMNGYNHLWKADGRFSILGGEDHRDLVSEVQFVPLNEQPKEEIVVKPLKLEVGKYYKDSDGDVYGPIEKHTGHPSYPFTDGDLIWTENGNYCNSGESDYDLIKEVPNPNQETQQSEQEETKVKFKEITLAEVLEILKNEGSVFATFGDLDGHFEFDSDSSISHLLKATKFEIEVKPVVKYLVVYGDFYNFQNITATHYASIEAFYSDYDKSQYPHAELIQFTRKEF